MITDASDTSYTIDLRDVATIRPTVPGLDPDRVRVVSVERLDIVQVGLDLAWSCGRCGQAVALGETWWLSFEAPRQLAPGGIHQAVLCTTCAPDFAQLAA